ncbi:MAG: hypothetical protein ACKO5J_12515 [Rubrivivax sp.]
MPRALCALAAGVALQAGAQDLRSQCTPLNATEVLRAIYPGELAQYPALAALMADPAGAPVRAYASADAFLWRVRAPHP